MSAPPSSITFGILSRSSLEQMLSTVFSPPRERLVVPLPPPSSEVKEIDVTIKPREQCIATTLGDSRCKNMAKPSLVYCYTHRGQSSTKNV